MTKRLDCVDQQLCPVCDSINYTVRWRDDGYDYGNCANCGLAFLRPFDKGSFDQVGDASSSVTKSSYLAMMNDLAEHRGRIAVGIAKRRLEAYRSILGYLPRRICEIGAGDGAFADAYSYLGIDYLGLDIHHEIVKRAQSLGRQVFLGGPEVLRESNQFDVIFFSQVLEHILAPKIFLRQISSALGDNGIIHLDVPNDAGLTATVRKLTHPHREYGFLQPPYHQIAYNHKTLTKLLDLSGFQLFWLSAKGNMDPVWGQLTVGDSLKGKALLYFAGAIGMGSLLVALAKNTVEKTMIRPSGCEKIN